MGDHPIWIVKDPLSHQYTQLREEEYFILQMLDGTTSLAEIQDRFQKRFAPQILPADRAHAFLGQLHENGLLLSDAPGQSQQLLQRAQSAKRRASVQRWTSILAIRFRGFDPQRFLDWLYPKCQFLFTRFAVGISIILAVAALMLVVVHFDELQSRLPDFQAFFGRGNLIWLLATLAIVKIAHELGHGLACRHFGGECHELGLMLVFTPCLYCNVSDAWMLPNKWHRVAISAAGMYVEIVLASICTFLWWDSEPGLLNMVCLNVMFICSVSTVLMNGNPLLRYDGYFILSDILEVSNLAQQSRSVIVAALTRWCLGVKTPDGRSLATGRKGWIALYGVLSMIYRIWLISVILWFCYQVLKPLHLEVFGMLLTIVVLTGMAFPPLAAAVARIRNPAWRQQIHRRRSLLTCVCVALLLVGLLAVPLPFRVRATTVIQPVGAQRVYVRVPGRLQQTVSAGTGVSQNQTLAHLVNEDLEKELADLTSQQEAQRTKLSNLLIQKSEFPELAASIPSARETLDALQRRVEAVRDQTLRLQLNAPLAGTVLPPPARQEETFSGAELKHWHGTPLEDRNLGSYLETGTLFCLIGDPAKLEAIFFIDQEDIQFVRRGQRVRIWLDQTPGSIAYGTIHEIAEIDVKLAPRQLIDGQYLPVKTDKSGTAQPLQTLYRARVVFDPAAPNVLIGARGTAKILAEPRSLANRIGRYLATTFNFRI